MAIPRWEPFRDLITLRDSIDRMFEEAFVRVRGNGDGFFMLRETPALDIYETDKEIKVEIPLSGIKPEDVEVTLTGTTLMIKGETRAREEVKEDRYYRREVRYGAFTRSVVLPEVADIEKPEATFADGVLVVTFPKVVAVEPKRLEIKQPEKEQEAVLG
ncbi:MAG TPA: Hsp20/alpha crystallin family protein [Herpetosiphonaceae bacterium]